MNPVEKLTVAQREQFSPFVLSYAEGMMRQLDNPSRSKPIIGENIFPTALLTEQERQKYFKVDSYAAIRGNEQLLQRAKQIHVVVHNLDAGIGSSVKREQHLQELAPFINRGENPTIGSKATDLYQRIDTEHGPVYANVAELRLTREIEGAERYSQVTIRPIVNNESASPVAALMDAVTVRSRMGMEEPMTYAQRIAQAHNVQKGPTVLQESLPTIDIQSGKIRIDKTAPGGHGQAAAQIIYEIAELKEGNIDTVRKITNGDGFTNEVPPEAIALTADRAVFTMFTTTALPCDVKGGKASVKRLPNGTMVPYLLEIAQAKDAKQEDIFYKMGMETDDLPQELAERHQPGEQYFNTNSVAIAEKPLRELMQAVKDELGEEFYKYMIAPEFFLNPNGDVYQFDGAMGSLILRMNEIIETDERVQEIWQRVSKGRDFVRFVNIEPEYRDEFFGPIKFPVDKVEKERTTHFTFDQAQLCPVNTRPGHVTHWGGDLVEKKTFFADVTNTEAAFGDMTDTSNLDALTVRGPVLFANSTMIGTIDITYANKGATLEDAISLNHPLVRQMLGQSEDGKLHLENIKIVIDEQGNIRQESLN